MIIEGTDHYPENKYINLHTQFISPLVPETEHC